MREENRGDRGQVLNIRFLLANGTQVQQLRLHSFQDRVSDKITCIHVVCNPRDFDSLVLKHGAAGFELDRAERSLGTPAHALVLASSSGHSDAYQHVIEEVLMSDSQQGGTVSSKVRADMVYFEYPKGGAVFSASSIAWCGALSHNQYDNNVSRITDNVLRRFAADGPLSE